MAGEFVSSSGVTNGLTDQFVDPLVFVAICMILIVCALAGIGVAALWARHRGRRIRRHRQPLEPASGDTSPGQADSRFGLLLVVADIVDTAVVVDGLVVDDHSPLGPVGWPVSVRLGRPKGTRLDEAMRILLGRWVAEDAVVRFVVTDGKCRRRVSITDGTSTLRFDLEPFDHQRADGVGP